MQVNAPERVAQTSIAQVWKVRQYDGTPAALKIYENGLRNEACAADYLSQINGQGAVSVLSVRDNAVLLEWLEGPTLGDLSRAGEDERACAELVDVATRLHGQTVRDRGYPRIQDWLQAVLDLRCSADVSSEVQRDVVRCQALARDLVNTPQDQRVLHGDLHHDNVMQTARGPVAFDPKGVVGEAAYELANAFRHPRGKFDVASDPRRIERFATQVAEGLSVDRHRLLTWIPVKIALSISWRCGGVLKADPETELLAVALETRDRSLNG